jgi:hypothetical protein
METILKRDYPTYEIRQDIDNKDYLIFIKSIGRYYSQGFYTIKAAVECAEKRIKEGRI